jgi:shikimate 5-dehydrogenase
MSSTGAGDDMQPVASVHRSTGTPIPMDMHPVPSAITGYTEGVSVTPPAALRAPEHIDEHTKWADVIGAISTSP